MVAIATASCQAVRLTWTDEVVLCVRGAMKRYCRAQLQQARNGSPEPTFAKGDLPVRGAATFSLKKYLLGHRWFVFWRFRLRRSC